MKGWELANKYTRQVWDDEKNESDNEFYPARAFSVIAGTLSSIFITLECRHPEAYQSALKELQN